MELLKERILKDGILLSGGVLRVDNFINHQIDAVLMMDIAKEFVARFAGREITKVVTVEASGIAPAIFVGYLLKVPVLFAKKNRPNTMDNSISTSVYSFTKSDSNEITMCGDYLTKEDKILFIDDFLANGNTALGVLKLAEFQKAEVAGMGFIIEKGFQDGASKLKELGVDVVSLAKIKSLGNCEIIFE